MSTRKQSNGADSAEMRELASRICRDYLSGAWKSVTAQNVGFKHISGGLSNLLYQISLPAELAKEMSEEADEPKEVLVRVYGQMHGERALEALITESVVFTLLSERGLGPKLHGIFPGGRIEQYINARPLRTAELADPGLSTQIAHKMAAIHGMEVPLHKEPGWLWETIERWLKSYETRLRKGALPQCAERLNSMDLRGETLWLRRRLDSEQSPVVFCHNDMQEGNILIDREEETCFIDNNNLAKRIVVIDFEYCSYNYRSFDIANHFVEWIYDYTASEPPFFKENVGNYPSKEQRFRFIEAYLKERTGLISVSKEDVEEVDKEVSVFTLASHLFWGLWGVMNAETSQIPFGYWEYTMSRLDHYFRLKKWVEENLPGKR